MKDVRDSLYKEYYSSFKKGEARERFGFLHIRLWYKEKYLPLLKHLDRDSAILDIGCGQGFMLKYMQSEGFNNLTGIDISEEQVKIAQAKGFNVIQTDAVVYLKENRGSFDAIMAIDIIEHFKKEELLELLPLIWQALKPGGTLILQTPNGDGLMPNYVIYGDFTHFTILSPLSLRHILTINKFETIKVKELGPAFLIHFPLFITWQFIRFFAMFIKFVEIGRIQTCWTESMICSCRKPFFMT